MIIVSEIGKIGQDELVEIGNFQATKDGSGAGAHWEKGIEVDEFGVLICDID